MVRTGGYGGPLARPIPANELLCRGPTSNSETKQIVVPRKAHYIYSQCAFFLSFFIYILTWVVTLYYMHYHYWRKVDQQLLLTVVRAFVKIYVNEM